MCVYQMDRRFNETSLALARKPISLLLLVSASTSGEYPRKCEPVRSVQDFHKIADIPQLQSDVCIESGSDTKVMLINNVLCICDLKNLTRTSNISYQISHDISTTAKNKSPSCKQQKS